MPETLNSRSHLLDLNEDTVVPSDRDHEAESKRKKDSDGIILKPGDTVRVTAKDKLRNVYTCSVGPHGERFEVPINVLKEKERKDWTSADLCASYLYPLLRRTGLPFYLSFWENEIGETKCLGEKFTGCYIIASRLLAFAPLIDSLERHYDAKSSKTHVSADGPFIWLDLLATDHATRIEAYRADIHEKDNDKLENYKTGKKKYIEKVLPNYIERYEEVLVFADDLLDPYFLTRTWCLYELHCALKSKNKKSNIEIVYVPNEDKIFQAVLNYQDTKKEYSKQKSIKDNDLKCSNEMDKKIIEEVLQVHFNVGDNERIFTEALNGLYDKMINKFMTTDRMVRTKRKEKIATVATVAITGRELSMLLRMRNKPSEACKLVGKVLEWMENIILEDTIESTKGLKERYFMGLKVEEYFCQVDLNLRKPRSAKLNDLESIITELGKKPPKSEDDKRLMIQVECAKAYHEFKIGNTKEESKLRQSIFDSLKELNHPLVDNFTLNPVSTRTHMK